MFLFHSRFFVSVTNKFRKRIETKTVRLPCMYLKDLHGTVNTRNAKTGTKDCLSISLLSSDYYSTSYER
jgi:hypothetical protein